MSILDPLKLYLEAVLSGFLFELRHHEDLEVLRLFGPVLEQQQRIGRLVFWEQRSYRPKYVKDYHPVRSLFNKLALRAKLSQIETRKSRDPEVGWCRSQEKQFIDYRIPLPPFNLYGLRRWTSSDEYPEDGDLY
ncbi:hypothetical protein FRB90_011510 [Tulasnella sp. 427]|nr:hypothetical protein FRB90_011510 [Tulasnella sp. 427]